MGVEFGRGICGDLTQAETREWLAMISIALHFSAILLADCSHSVASSP
jgi:hypothetical protein